MASTRGNGCLAVSIIFTVLSLVAIAFRIGAIHIVGRRYKAHDYLAFAGAVAGIAQLVIVYLAVLREGMGDHLNELSTDNTENLVKLLVADELIWLIATTLVKLSILLLYLDLFGTHKRTSIVNRVLIAVVACFFVAFLLELFLICHPFTAWWDGTSGRNCGNVHAAELTSCSFNTALDLLIVLLPIPALWGMELPREKRFAVNALLSLGFVILAVNVVRLSFLANVNPYDFSYSFSPQGLLTALEVQVGLFVACLPTLGPILHRRNHQSNSSNDTLAFRSSTDHIKPLTYSKNPPSPFPRRPSGPLRRFTSMTNASNDELGGFHRGSNRAFDDSQLESQLYGSKAGGSKVSAYALKPTNTATSSRRPSNAGPSIEDSQINVQQEVEIYETHRDDCSFV